MFCVKGSSTKTIIFILLALLGALMPEAARSQNNSGVTITSTPSGATVVLTGDNTVAGVTPTTFSQGLTGYYKIRAYLNGYETYNSSIILTGRDAATIQISLSAKTRLKAAARSILIPGWGQYYNETKFKAALVAAGAVASGIATGVLHLRYLDRRDEYYDVRDKFNRTRSVVEREAMLTELFDAQKRAYDAERNRNLGLAVMAGVWAYGVIDAFVFFPHNDIKVSGASLSFQPTAIPEGAMIVGRLTF